MNVKEKIGYKIIDNVLDQKDLKQLQDIYFGEITWYYREKTTTFVTDKASDYFCHALYNDNQTLSINFPYIYILFSPILKIHRLQQIRANMLLSKQENSKTGFHTDLSSNEVYNKSAIFYLNTNNGKTFLHKTDSIEIDAIENRLLIFDNQIEHSASYQTDVRRRIVLNFNYFTSDDKS